MLAWGALRLLTAKAGGFTRRNTRTDQSDTPKQAGTEPMHQCAYCGIYVPASEVVMSADGRNYCGPGHRDAAHDANRK